MTSLLEFSDDHWLHHPMKIKTTIIQFFISFKSHCDDSAFIYLEKSVASVNISLLLIMEIISCSKGKALQTTLLNLVLSRTLATRNA